MKHPLNRMKWQRIEAGRKYLQITHRTEMCKEISKCYSIVFQPPNIYAWPKQMDCAVKGSLSKSGMFGTYTFQIMVWPLQAPWRKHVSCCKVLPDECACLAFYTLGEQSHLWWGPWAMSYQTSRKSTLWSPVSPSREWGIKPKGGLEAPTPRDLTTLILAFMKIPGREYT